MGSLRDREQTIHLPASTLVGRGPHADWILDSRLVSTEHARIGWRQSAWGLKDLGSRNGTFVNGKRLPSGDTVWLQLGMTVGFGSPDTTWEVTDIGGPRPMATSPSGELIVGTKQLLLLPKHAPQVAILRDMNDRWYVERNGRNEPLMSHVEIDSQRWRVRVPSLVPETIETGGRSIEEMQLVFTVSRDQEHIELMARFQHNQIDLGSRAHHHLLLILARQRMQDSDSDATERGWAYADDVAQSLGVSEEALNLHTFRARKQLALAGVEGAAQLIQRRGQSRQIRLGVARVEIH